MRAGTQQREGGEEAGREGREPGGPERPGGPSRTEPAASEAEAGREGQEPGGREGREGRAGYVLSACGVRTGMRK